MMADKEALSPVDMPMKHTSYLVWSNATRLKGGAFLHSVDGNSHQRPD